MTTNYLGQGLRQGQSMGQMLTSNRSLSEAKNKVMSGQDPMVVMQWLMAENPNAVSDFVAWVESISQSQPDIQGMFGNNFGQQQQQQPQQSGMGGMGGGNPFMSGMNFGQNIGGNFQSMFGGGGAAAGGANAGGGASAATANAPLEVFGTWGGTSGGAAAGGGASAGGGAAGGGSWLASAGPWAALAAAILINENEAREGGYRDEDDWEYAKDLFGGKVMSDDINYRWSPKLFGDDDYGFGGDMEIAGELSSWDLSNAWDKLKNDSTIAKLLKKVF